MGNIELRPAVEADLSQINDIYNHYVSTSTCVWTTQLRTEQERREWFAAHDDTTPIIVMQQDAQVVAWGALSLFKTAYMFHKTVESSLYVHHEFQRQGIGRRLLGELLRRAREADFVSVIAVISSDQEPSLALHKSVGFEESGLLQKVGYKFGRWLDAVYLQLHLESR